MLELTTGVTEVITLIATTLAIAMAVMLWFQLLGRFISKLLQNWRT